MTRKQINGWVYGASVLLAVWGSACAQAEPQKGGNNMTVSTGNEVSLEYTLTLENKEVIDTNVGGQPLTYTQGSQQIIPGLEEAIEGMTQGESKQVTVTPQRGYGEVNPKALQEIPKDQIPTEAQKVGMQLQGKDASGRIVRPRVAEVKKDTVVLDFNHPLAGKTLFFDVKVLEIKAKSAAHN